ncbi:uncharacterized protein LOC101556761 isoform X1 [Sorex araneus]|uniref:uncharacterized protein LOC101556761 isoform X1 n=2 Tax=Sorex araneus TaxID=42254 RepID=UPI0024338690|nr:uncharacterized protein LOC101556761 isoform X1 [Sorex araneus]
MMRKRKAIRVSKSWARPARRRPPAGRFPALRGIRPAAASTDTNTRENSAIPPSCHSVAQAQLAAASAARFLPLSSARGGRRREGGSRRWGAADTTYLANGGLAESDSDRASFLPRADTLHCTVEGGLRSAESDYSPRARGRPRRPARRVCAVRARARRPEVRKRKLAAGARLCGRGWERRRRRRVSAVPKGIRVRARGSAENGPGLQPSVPLRSRAAISAAAARWAPPCRNHPWRCSGDNMPTAKQLADIGYKTFSTSMILLTVYGGYLCSARVYQFFQRRSSERQASEEQKTSGVL